MNNNSLERSYALLISLLEKNRWPWWKIVTFRGLCRRLGIPYEEMDIHIYNELGISGWELLESYRHY